METSKIHALVAVQDRNSYNDAGSLSRAPAGQERCLALWPNDIDKNDWTTTYYACRYIGREANKKAVHISYEKRSDGYDGRVITLPTYVYCNGKKVPTVIRNVPLMTSHMGQVLQATMNSMGGGRDVTAEDNGFIEGRIGAAPVRAPVRPLDNLRAPRDARRRGKEQAQGKIMTKKADDIIQCKRKLKFCDGLWPNLVIHASNQVLMPKQQQHMNILQPWISRFAPYRNGSKTVSLIMNK